MGAPLTGRGGAPARPKRPGRLRLDHVVVAQGLAPSRHQAEAVIRAGEIYLAGQRLEKPGILVPQDAVVERRARGPAFVSRGGIKLAGVLDALAMNPEGLVVLDVGASTGGFTDCVLQRGARRVYAVDVGHGQLHWRLRQDPRVVVLEGRHASRLQPDDLPELADLATVDCSFISVLKVLPAVAQLVRPDGAVLALIKPQFEAGPREAPRGVVRDRAIHEAVVRRVVCEMRSMGWVPLAVVPSPILGPEGNREFFVALRKGVGGRADDLEGEDLERGILRAVYGQEARQP